MSKHFDRHNAADNRGVVVSGVRIPVQECPFRQAQDMLQGAIGGTDVPVAGPDIASHPLRP